VHSSCRFAREDSTRHRTCNGTGLVRAVKARSEQSEDCHGGVSQKAQAASRSK
jgi:hypothetical protein